MALVAIIVLVLLLVFVAAVVPLILMFRTGVAVDFRLAPTFRGVCDNDMPILRQGAFRVF